MNRTPFFVRYAKHILKGRTATLLFSGTLMSFVFLFLVLFCVNCVKSGASDVSVFFENAGTLEDLNDTVQSVFNPSHAAEDSVESRFRENDAQAVFSASAVLSNAVCPVEGRITSGYGYRMSPFEDRITFHTGVDIAAAEGTAIRCVADGTVTSVGYNATSGYYVTVTHENGFISTYCHLKEATAAEGDLLYAGKILGLCGDTGKTTGPHLHLKLTLNGKTVDPCLYVPIG